MMSDMQQLIENHVAMTRMIAGSWVSQIVRSAAELAWPPPGSDLRKSPHVFARLRYAHADVATNVDGGSRVTDFNVQTAGLRELSAMMGRAREDIDGANTHLTKMESFQGSDGEGLLNVCLDGHEEAYRTLSDWLGKLADPTVSGTAAAVAESANYYETTDATSAANLDATYPTTNVIEYKEHTGYLDVESEGSARFADVVTPGNHLTGPKDYTDELEKDGLDPSQAVSPSALLNQAIEGVSEVAVLLGWLKHSYNPHEELAKKFVGDWAGARQAADILRNVGRAVNEIGLNIQWAAQGTEQVWQGNAGDGAAVYLMNLARRFDVDNAWKPIDTLAQQYVDASSDMMDLRDSAMGVIESITDAAFAAAVACGIGVGAVSTGVGAPIAIGAALFAGYEISAVVTGIKTLLSVVSDLETVTSALKAAQDGFAGPGRLSLPALPPAPISVPGGGQ